MIHLKLAPSPLPRLQAGAVYFVTCFLVGCALGPVRELWLAPRLGYDRALAIEMLTMLLVSAAAARHAIRRAAGRMSTRDRLAVGGIALLLLVAAEQALARLVSGQSIVELWASQPAVSQVTTALIMLLYALMPALVGPGRAAAPEA